MPRRFLFSGAMAVAFALYGCGGGSAGNPIPPSNSAITSSAMIGPSGGTVTAQLASGVATLTVPAGALASTTSVTFSVFAADAALHTFSRSARPKLQPKATADQQFLIGFTIDDGNVPIYKTLTISVTGSFSVPSGDVVRLAMFGANGYNDVDEASGSATALTNKDSASYVGVSTLGGSAHPYAFYAVPSGAAAAPAAITLSATSTTAQPLPILSSASFTAAGSDANGNALAFIPSYALDSATVGTIVGATTAPYAATVTTGNVSATANIVVTDAVRKISSNSKVNVGSQRPTSGGDAYHYTGSWSQTFARVGQPAVTTTAALADAVSVMSGQTFNSVPNLYKFESVDTATANLDTQTTTTDEYDGVNLSATPITYSDYGVDTSDGAGSTTHLTYATPQLIDELPEASGQSWSNTGASTTLENDASGETSTLTYAADGSYTGTTTYPEGSIFGAAAQVAFIENADGSGSNALSVGSFSLPITIAAPASGSIAITVSRFWGIPSTSVAAWFATPPPLYTETNKNLGVTALPAGCTTGTGIPTATNKLERTISRLDTIAGFTETQTIDSYVATGFGVVCVTISDVLNNYYNMQGDDPNQFEWSSTAYQTTTTTQTLALQSTTAVGTQAHRMQSMTHVALATFDSRMLKLRLQQQRKAFAHMYHTMKGAQR